MQNAASDGPELTRRQRQFVAAMVTAPTVTDAAEAAGVAERTGRLYLTQPAVKQALATALDVAMGEATQRAVGAMTSALATLEAIHQDPDAPPGARVSAARVILDAGPKLREGLELAERVDALEKRLDLLGRGGGR